VPLTSPSADSGSPALNSVWIGSRARWDRNFLRATSTRPYTQVSSLPLPTVPVVLTFIREEVRRRNWLTDARTETRVDVAPSVTGLPRLVPDGRTRHGIRRNFPPMFNVQQHAALCDNDGALAATPKRRS